MGDPLQNFRGGGLGAARFRFDAMRARRSLPHDDIVDFAIAATGY
jgi:hypothetical protein